MDGATRFVEIILFVIGGFYLFRALVQRYILTNLQQEDGALQAVEVDRSRKYPFLTAWIGFVLISVMIYAMLAWFFFSLIPVSDFTATALAYSAVYAFVGFFVFRKAIQSYIVSDYYTKAAQISRTRSVA